ncbi:MAG TPA: hypothetical protein VK783_10930 [Bacteroidia bacterium]|jgi:hypothetical protein|nr:hypothetical protein [Bacteroidia bacterium]
MKIDRTPIKLKAGIPFSIDIAGGFDCYETKFTFEYSTAVHGKKIELAFKTITGQLVSRIITLDGGGHQTFVYNDTIENELIGTRFGFIELKSSQDLDFTISVETEQESVWQ